MFHTKKCLFLLGLLTLTTTLPCWQSHLSNFFSDEGGQKKSNLLVKKQRNKATRRVTQFRSNKYSSTTWFDKLKKQISTANITTTIKNIAKFSFKVKYDNFNSDGVEQNNLIMNVFNNSPQNMAINVGSSLFGKLQVQINSPFEKWGSLKNSNIPKLDFKKVDPTSVRFSIVAKGKKVNPKVSLNENYTMRGSKKIISKEIGQFIVFNLEYSFGAFWGTETGNIVLGIIISSILGISAIGGGAIGKYALSGVARKTAAFEIQAAKEAEDLINLDIAHDIQIGKLNNDIELLEDQYEDAEERSEGANWKKILTDSRSDNVHNDSAVAHAEHREIVGNLDRLTYMDTTYVDEQRTITKKIYDAKCVSYDEELDSLKENSYLQNAKKIKTFKDESLQQLDEKKNKATKTITITKKIIKTKNDELRDAIEEVGTKINSKKLQQEQIDKTISEKRQVLGVLYKQLQVQQEQQQGLASQKVNVIEESSSIEQKSVLGKQKEGQFLPLTGVNILMDDNDSIWGAQHITQNVGDVTDDDTLSGSNSSSSPLNNDQQEIAAKKEQYLINIRVSDSPDVNSQMSQSEKQQLSKSSNKLLDRISELSRDAADETIIEGQRLREEMAEERHQKSQIIQKSRFTKNEHALLAHEFGEEVFAKHNVHVMEYFEQFQNKQIQSVLPNIAEQETAETKLFYNSLWGDDPPGSMEALEFEATFVKNNKGFFSFFKK